MNPGQSVKDRAGKWMILEAEKRGDLKPGGLVVEATAGNTGIGLAVVASARGYRTLILIPETQSQEKKDMLRLCGAELIEVPALPFSNPNNYQHVGRRLADQLRKTEPNGVLFADQWNNLDNAKAHYESTGPEIWAADRRQDRRLHLLGRHRRHAGRHQPLSEGKAPGHRQRLRRSAWLCDVRAVQERHRQIDAGRLDHRRHRARPRHARHRDREGRRRLPDSGRGSRDGDLRPARARGPVPRRLDRRQRRRRDPARQTARTRQDHRHHPCDSGNRYQSKLFNPEFMRSKNLPVPAWLEKRTKIDVPFEKV